MGSLGTIRLVQVEYVQGGKADEEKAMPSVLPWKYDPARGGPSLVMGDIGTHAHNLTRFITGLELDEVSAEIGNIVPGRLVHDFAGALLRFDKVCPWKFSGSRKPRLASKIVCAFASAAPKAVWNGCRNFHRLSPSSLCTHPRKTGLRTDLELCRYLRARAGSSLVTPKDFTKALRIFILMPLKPSAHAGPARKLIRWLCISRILWMACWACAS